MKKDYSILVGGQAGQGSRKAGLVIAKLFNHLGYRIFIYDDYQSLIRGGHNFSQIRAKDSEVLSHQAKIDFLLALDQETIEKHKNNLSAEGVIVYNQAKAKSEQGVALFVEKITKELGGIPIMANTALIAGFAKIIGIEWEAVQEVFKKEFKKVPPIIK